MDRLRGDPHTLGLAAVAAAAVLWAAAAVVARGLFDDGVDPLELTQARAYLSFLGLAVLSTRWRRSGSGGRNGWKVIVPLGLAIASVNATYYIAIQRLPVAVALVVQYTAPALVVLWVSARRSAWPRPDILGALLAAMLGVALAAELVTAQVDADTVGLIMAISSAVLFATYTLLSERAERHFGPTGAMFRAFGVAAVAWLIFQAPQGWPEDLIAPANLPRIVFVGLGGTLAPFLLYVWGLRHVSSERAVIAASLEPPAGAVIAWVWLGQSLSGLQILGGSLVLVAVALLQVRRRRVARAPDP